MHSILCEGKYDVWFFDHISKEMSINTHIAHDLNKFLELASPKCLYYLSKTNPLVILGDNGRYDACNKYLSRIIKNKLGKYEEDLLIFYIVDSDYCSESEVIRVLSENIQSLQGTFTEKLIIKNVKNEFTLAHPDARYKIIVKALMVPESLEKKAVDYFCDKYKIKKEGKGLHNLIDHFAINYYNNDKEKMFIEVADNCKDEEWVAKIFENLSEYS